MTRALRYSPREAAKSALLRASISRSVSSRMEAMSKFSSPNSSTMEVKRRRTAAKAAVQLPVSQAAR